jgi:hypothetical protein
MFLFADDFISPPMAWLRSGPIMGGRNGHGKDSRGGYTP